MVRVVVVLVALLVIEATVYCITGSEVLTRVEEILSREKDRESLVELVLYRDGKEKERREMRIWNSGKEKRVVKFVSPESIKGIGVLSLPNGEMYVYLPAYKRVRAIHGSAKDQSFQATDFSYREIGSFNYSQDFEAEILSEDQNNYVLALKRKPNSEWSYDKVLMVVCKNTFLPKKLEMYERDRIKKVLEILETDKKGNYYILSRIKMTTLTANTSTEVILKDVKFDQGLENKGIFTQRFLER
ncbi:MAG: outer membrane lipoprotein-sorting protein [Brevinematia bacterium]